MTDKEYILHIYRELGNLREGIVEDDYQDYETALERSLNLLNMIDEDRVNSVDPSDFLLRDIKKCAILAIALVADNSKAESLFDDYLIMINTAAEQIE